MMALTQEDREMVRLMTVESASAMSEKMIEASRAIAAEEVRKHKDTCPVAIDLDRAKRLMVGFCIGMGAASGFGGVIGALIGQLFV